MLDKLRFQLKHGKLFRSFLGVGGMHMLGIPLGLAINILLARLLGPEEFGQYVFVMSALTLLALPVSGGLPQLMTREVARFSNASEWSLFRGVVRAAHVWVLLVSAIVIAGFFGAEAIGLLPTESKWVLFGIVLFLVPFQGLNAIRNGAIKGLGFPALAELPLLTIQPVLLLIGIGLLALGDALSAASALWVQVAVHVAAFGLATALFLHVRPRAANMRSPSYKNALWLKALLPFSLISLVGTFNAQIGIVLLGLLGTDEGVGVLRVADRAAQFVSLVLMLVTTVIAPNIVKLWQENDRQGLQRLSRQSARAAFFAALIIALILFLFGKPIVAVTFGSDYTESVFIPMLIIIIGQLFNVSMGSVGILLAMSGHEKMTLLGQVCGLVATVASAVVLIPKYGAEGAAAAVSAGLVTWNIVMAFLVKRHLKIMPGIL